ncbi:ATP-binding cassette domain-containing protein [Nocardioides zeae]|uniref:ABC-type multidrug transport system fused ATPase/permease subunit n=1 Tax=Nocardioides zeae TaxID=1457234 RepID=A0AAJ1X1R9_9ACTN|nr:ABC transporter ATP-binding protein [Nocardioides zeae]MDQ1102847.1 ABC-type multidrug transport system fused ATPase/permease subunit [Nocardioides zeae]
MTDRHPGALRAALLLSLEADRRSTIITLANFALRPAAVVIATWMLALVIDAAASGDRSVMWTVAAVAALLTALHAVTAPLAVEISARMIEATSVRVDERLMSLVGGLHGIDRLEDPELLDRLEVLDQERVYLAEGADALSLILGVVVRGGLTVVLLAMINPLLLFTLALAVPAVLASRREQQRRSSAVSAAASDTRRADALLRTAIGNGASEIRLFGLAEELRVRTRELRTRANRAVVAATAASLVGTLVGAAIFAAGFVFSLGVVVHGYGVGSSGVGEIMLTLALVTSLNVQVASAIAFSAFLQQTRSSSSKLLDLEELCRAEAQRWRGEQSPDRELQHGVRLEDVTFRYPGAEQDALREVSLELPAGAIVAVVGNNGSGKSTLIKLLAGLYQPSSGAVLVDGRPLVEMDVDQWHAATSACFQDFSRLEFDLQQSVGHGDLARVDDRSAVEGALAQSGAEDLPKRLPQGLQTGLGKSLEDGVELSGGQWQRVALARARMRPAPLLLVLDEPSSAIDPLAEEQLLHSYVATARQTSERAGGITLFSSHRLSTTRRADIVVVLDGGKVVEHGDHDTLMSMPDGHYREMFRRQALSYGVGPFGADRDGGARTIRSMSEDVR